jgi:hypothetical protein
MSIRWKPGCALLVAAVVSLPAIAGAQTAPPVTAPLLAAGQSRSQPPQQQQQQQRTGSSAPGVGIGVKGGVLFSSFRQARNDYTSSTGWQGGLFIGGNRAGALGVQTELTYAKRGADSGGVSTDTYYLEIPLLLRINVGSSNRNTGVNVYALAGPAADILLKAKLEGLDIKSQYKDVDWNVLGGVGVEVSRFIIEGRFNWGLANVLDGPGSDLKTQSFAILGGIRFN